MSRDEFGQIIAVIQNDIKYVVRAIDEFKEQSKLNGQTHSDLYNKIERERRDNLETYCTKEQYHDVWTIVKGIVAYSVAQIVALLFLLISKFLG